MNTSGAAPTDLSRLPRRKVKLARPPFVHPHDQVATEGPAIIEKEIQLDEDAWVQAMTFNGSVPDPLVVVHEGDYVELTLFNPPENMMQHNIDFHAATGALGGGSLMLVNPGEKRCCGSMPPARGGCLSLRAGRPDDPLACRVGHVGGDHDAAARRAEGSSGQSGVL